MKRPQPPKPPVKPSWHPLATGQTVKVCGYHTGDFVGEIESIGPQLASLLITDPLRPYQKRGCPFPQCIGEPDHEGQHVFPTLCAGHRIEVPWRLAKFEPHEASKVIEFRRGVA